MIPRGPAVEWARTAAEPPGGEAEPEVVEADLAPPNSVLAYLLSDPGRDQDAFAAGWWPLAGVAVESEAPAVAPGLDREVGPGEVAIAPPGPQEQAEPEPEPAEAGPAPQELSADAEPAPEERAADVEPADRNVAASGPAADGEEPAAGELADLDAWSARVRQATTTRFRPSPPPDEAEALAPIQAAAVRTRAREAARRAAVGADAQRAVPTPPDAGQGLDPPPPIPVSAAEAAVTAAVGKRLPAQTMPAVERYTHTKADGSTQDFQPPVGANLPAGSGVTLQMTPPAPAPPGREGAAAVAKVRKAGATVEEGRRGAGRLTLDTAPRPARAGKPGGPTVTKADVATILGRLRASAPADAAAMLIGVKKSLYPRGALHFELPDLGSDLVAGIEEEIGRSIEAIRAQAGIDAAALEAATVAARTAVATGSAQVAARIDATGKESSEAIDQEGKASADAIAGARDAVDDASYEKAMAAEGGADPEAIRARRDRLVGRAYGRLAPEDIRYEREGKDRLQALTLVEVSYLGGYPSIARQVNALIQREAEAAAAKAKGKAKGKAPAPAPASAPAPTAPAPAASAQVPASPVEAWAMERVRVVRADFVKLRADVTTATQAHRAGIAAATTAARDLIQEWAETEIGERVSWWERLWDRFKRWLSDAQVTTRAWKDARDAALLADLQGDMGFASDLVSGARRKEEMQAIGAMGGLSDAQKAIVAAYFEGPEQGNPLAAVAAGMRVRIAEGRRDHLSQEMKRLLMALPPASWDPVAKVAESEGGGVNIVARGNDFYKAVDQWGTDESGVYAALTGLTPLQSHALDLWYQAKHGHTIQWELEDELEESELDRAEALRKGDTVAADAAALHTAIDGPGTNEAEIWRALRTKTSQERVRLEQIYKEKYGKSLEDALRGDLSAEELARGLALREGNVAKADAIGLEAATRGKWHGGADTAEVEAIYGQIRAEVEEKAAKEGWTSDQLRAELLRRNGEVATAHAGVYPEKGGLQASFKAQLRGPALDLALGLADVDMARADAARLELEKRSFYTSDKAVNGILESQFTRARAEVSLDLEHDLRRRRELTLLRGQEWNEKAERTAMQGSIDDLAQKRSRVYMTALEERYDSSYSRWGRGGMQALIALNMSGPDRAKARDLVKQGGRLYPEQEVHYAVAGVGTDVDALKKLLKGKTPAQVKAVEDAWATRFPKGPTMRARIMDEVSGRDQQDLTLLLEGAPETPEDRLKLAKRKLKYEQNAYFAGGLFSSAERTALEDEVAKLDKTVEDLKRTTKGSDEAEYLQWELDQREVSVESAIEEHRRSVDSIADTAAMIAAITAAVLVTALTAGTAGLAVAGLMGAIAATEATVVTKLLLKGSAYSEEEMLVDVASGAVDAVVAFATAGVGNALMRVADGIPIGPLAKLALSPSVAKRMVAHGVAQGVEGVVSSLPSAVVGTLADENTWRRGDMLTNVVTGVGMGVAMGAGLSGGMGALGGRARPNAPGAPHLDAGRPLDLEAAAGVADGSLPPAHADPGSRAAQWNAQRVDNPGLDYDQFVRDLEAGRVTPDPAAAARFRRTLQAELTAGLPPGQGRLLDGVPVEVLSDADFARMTRSASGQAVTVIDGGKPRILMRESADLHVLREEGIHAAQVLDRRTAHAASLLDEANMARWDRLPLQTKIEMYRAKLDLEIDAQHTLIAGLRDSTAAMPPGPGRAALASQLDAAARNLDTLSHRRIELDAFGPLDRLRARFGRGPLAARLDQPPRLFTKKAPPPTRGAIDALKADPNAPRRRLPRGQGSPREKVATRVELVGQPWPERSMRGSPPTPNKKGHDLYRLVEVEYRDGTVIRVEETVVRDSKPPRWVMRGSEANEAGAAAEAASLAQTRQMIDEARARGEKIVTLGSAHQGGGGEGFDEVYFRFKPDGSVEVVVVEVKNYPNRWVPFEDFTAVTDNLGANLDELRRIVRQPRGLLPEMLRDLPPRQLSALRKAVRALKTKQEALTLEIRLAPTTKLGTRRVGGEDVTPALTSLQKKFPGKVRAPPSEARAATVAAGGLVPPGAELRIGRELMDAATTAARLDVGRDRSGALRARFVRIFEQLRKLKKLVPPLRPVPKRPGVFRDAGGDPGMIRSVTASDISRGSRTERAAIEQIARETIDALDRPVPGTPRRRLRVFLDLGELNQRERQALRREIERQLEAAGRKSELLPRIHFAV